MNKRNVQVGKAIDVSFRTGENYYNGGRDNLSAYKKMLSIEETLDRFCKINILRKIAPHRYELIGRDILHEYI